MHLRYWIVLLLLAFIVVLPAFAADEDGNETGWSSTAEFGLVVTSGNSKTETLSFKDETIRTWERSSFTLRAGAIRSETTPTPPLAIDTGGGPVIVDRPSEVNAESYYFEGRFDKKIHERFFWFAGAGWDKNEPAGIDSRTKAFAGVGNIWRDDDKIKFRTDYALSYTDQEDVVPTIDSVGEFAGVRASWVYRHKLGKTTKYSNDFVVDYGLEESDNWRADMTNSVAVALNSRLALKVSLQHVYNNRPPTEVLAVVDGAGMPTGAMFPYELDELDTSFSTSLVVNF